MAFSNTRLRAMQGGQQGFGITLLYDARGTGGDAIATIEHTTNHFFPNAAADPATVDTFRRAVDAVPGAGTGAGRVVHVEILATDDHAWRAYFVDEADGGQIKAGAAAFNVP